MFRLFTKKGACLTTRTTNPFFFRSSRTIFTSKVNLNGPPDFGLGKDDKGSKVEQEKSNSYKRHLLPVAYAESFNNCSGDRITSTEKDPRNFEAEMNKTIRELRSVIENGFSQIHTEIGTLRTGIRTLHAEIMDTRKTLRTEIRTLHAETMDARRTLRTDIEKTCDDLRADIWLLVWQVRVLLGGMTLFASFLVGAYFFPNVFRKEKQASPAAEADDPSPAIPRRFLVAA